MTLVWIALIVAGYFVGSIPFGVWIGKIFYKTDITEHGSKNTGATNVWRVLGWVPGLSTFVLDFLKGFGLVWGTHHLVPEVPALAVLVGMVCIVGHNWSLFLKGKGGKGVATSAGVFLALMPIHTSIAILVFAIVFYFTRRISVGSMAAAIALVLSTFLTNTAPLYRAVSILASLMILVKHIPNIKRLIKGEEPMVGTR